MSKCREAFEDINSPCRQQFNTFIYDSWRINGIAFLENGEYKNPFIQERWMVWIRAWNASHNRCVELCESFINEAEEKDYHDVFTPDDCLKAIQSDKVNP